MAGLPPPPINDKPGSFTWLEWYRQLRNYVSTSGSVPWYIINFQGSNIADIAIRLHDTLQGLQGGTSGEHYHLTAAQHAALTAGPHNSLSGIQGGTLTERYHMDAAQYEAISHVTWNTGDGTMNISMNSSGIVTQQVGLETYFRVKASAAITEGQCIMATGAVGASAAIKAAPATGVTSGQVIIGIATEDIALNDFGYVTNFGMVRNIDTSAFAEGDVLYYNPAVTGGLTTTPPVYPNPKVTVAMVINDGVGSGSLFVRVTETPNGYTGVITTAKLTAGGANGSMTFTNGILTSQTAAT